MLCQIVVLLVEEGGVFCQIVVLLVEEGGALPDSGVPAG